MFRNDPAHTGGTGDDAITKQSVANSMLDKWTGTTGDNVESSPVVANNTVYVGSDDHNLYAYDAAGHTNCTTGSSRTCTPLWKATTLFIVEGAPAVDGGKVFVGSYDFHLYAYDAAGVTGCDSASPTRSCTPLWSATLGNIIYSSPTVVNGIVYVTSLDHSLYAFDAAGGNATCTGVAPNRTCNPIWKASAGDFIYSSPSVANNKVFVGSDDKNVYAFDSAGNTNCVAGTPRICSPLWTASTGDLVESTPAVDSGVVYVGSFDKKLYAFDAAGGNGSCTGPPSARTCAPLWTALTGGIVFSSPAVRAGTVYVGSDDKNLYAFDASGSTGCSGVFPSKACTPLWKATTGDVVESSPAVANGIVWVGSFDKKLYAFDAAGAATGCPSNCAPLTTFTTGGAILSSPAVSNGFVYVGSYDNKLYAFGLERTPPSPTITSPSSGATLSGTQTLTATSTDDVTTNHLEFRVTGGSFNDSKIGDATCVSGCGTTSSSWSLTIDTHNVNNGPYTLNAVATHPAKNEGRSPGVSITVAN
jgi:outer membrane protein assembly factor BamB